MAPVQHLGQKRACTVGAWAGTHHTRAGTHLTRASVSREHCDTDTRVDCDTDIRVIIWVHPWCAHARVYLGVYLGVRMEEERQEEVVVEGRRGGGQEGRRGRSRLRERGRVGTK